MNDEVELAPHHFAALVAPAIDRVFLASMAAGHSYGGPELSRRYGGPAATGFLVDFRARLAAPGGTVSGAGLAALTRYRDPAVCLRALDKQVAHGMIHRDRDGIRATDRGRAFLTDLYELHARVTAEIWVGHRERIGRLADALGQLLIAAVTGVAGVAGVGPTGTDEAGRVGGEVMTGTDAGSAFGAMALPYEPDGTPPGVLLLNRLDTFRYHRADAHAAAWTAAGHTARSIAELPPGPERLAIELETDRRAAGPYAVLTAPERLALLADLAALPA